VETTKVLLMFAIIGQLTIVQFKMSDMNHQLERIANNSIRR